MRPDKLRFDFTHPTQLTAEQRERVERLVNEKVFEAIPVRTFVTTIAEARALGAMALFGEKYGEYVRVVEIDGFSRELCGGTHVRSTAEIGPFVITSEGSVGSGARRIEAVTSGEAWAVLHGRSRELEDVRAELVEARKEAKKPKQQEAQADVEPEIVVVNETNVVVMEIASIDGDALLDLSDRLKQRTAPAAVVLGSRENGNVHLVANFDDSVAKRVSAGDDRQADRPDRRRRRRRPADDGSRGRQGSRQAAGGAREGPRTALGRAGMKVLALDYGSARTGVAVSDPTGTLARPVSIVAKVNKPAGFGELIALIHAEEPELIVVGLPLTLRGEHGAQADETAVFVDRLRAALEIPVEMWDERFTSVLADGDDARAAAHLLSSFLAWRSARV